MDSERVFFVTTVTIQRIPIFRQETAAKLLIDTFAHYRDVGKFRCMNLSSCPITFTCFSHPRRKCP